MSALIEMTLLVTLKQHCNTHYYGVVPRREDRNMILQWTLYVIKYHIGWFEYS